MAREAFDFGEVVGGNEDGGFGSAFEQAFDELIAHERIEAAERLIENDEFGMEGKRAGESELHFHPAGKSFDFAIEREIELLDERLLESGIPGGIERAEIIEQRADFHPFGDLLIFGDVADASVGFAADFAGIGTEDLGGAACGGDEIHKDFDGGGFAGTVLADEGVNGAFLDIESDVIESGEACISFG